MMAQYTNYPNAIDGSTQLPKFTDLVTPVNGESVNRLREAILAIENELGIQPSGTWSTVRARVDAIEAGLSGEGTPVPVDVTFEAVRSALGQASSAVGLNDQGLTAISFIEGGLSQISFSSNGIEINTNENIEGSGSFTVTSFNDINLSSTDGAVRIFGGTSTDIGGAEGTSMTIGGTGPVLNDILIGQENLPVINLVSTELYWNGEPLVGGGGVSGSRIEFDNNFMDTGEGSAIYSPDFVNIYSSDGGDTSVFFAMTPTELTINATIPDGDGTNESSITSNGAVFEGRSGGSYINIDQSEFIYSLHATGGMNMSLESNGGDTRMDLQDDQIIYQVRNNYCFGFTRYSSIATTNATPANFASFAIAGIDRPAVYDIYVSASTASSAAVATWVITPTLVVRSSVVTFISGAVSSVAPTASDASLSAARVSVTAISTNSIRVTVTGIAATNITWSCMIRQNIP